MKAIALTATLLAVGTLAQAQEVGQVISRTPVYQQVAMPRQVCTQGAPTAAATSGAGAIAGAIAGGIVGSAIGGNQGLATAAGMIGGAVLGDKAEAGNNAQVATTCTTQTILENRLVGYNVVYEYAGKQYTVQLAQDPGPTIALQVTPVGAAAAPAATAVPPVTTTTVVTRPAVVYAPAYAPAPVYYSPWPATSINLGWGWYGGGHRHWR